MLCPLINQAPQEWSGQFSKPGLSNLFNFISKVQASVHSFLLLFVDKYNQTGHLFSLYKKFKYIHTIISCRKFKIDIQIKKKSGTEPRTFQSIVRCSIN